jgi:hypothetical protein
VIGVAGRNKNPSGLPRTPSARSPENRYPARGRWRRRGSWVASEYYRCCVPHTKNTGAGVGRPEKGPGHCLWEGGRPGLREGAGANRLVDEPPHFRSRMPGRAGRRIGRVAHLSPAAPSRPLAFVHKKSVVSVWPRRRPSWAFSGHPFPIFAPRRRARDDAPRRVRVKRALSGRGQRSGWPGLGDPCPGVPCPQGGVIFPAGPWMRTSENVSRAKFS